MEYSQFLELVALLSGIASSILFCIGALGLSTSKIKELSTAVRGGNQAVTFGFLQQKYQFLAGVIFLTFSFLLQLVKLLACQPPLIIATYIHKSSISFIVFPVLALLLILVFVSLYFSKTLATRYTKEIHS